MNNRIKSYGVHIGTSSILLIFVTLSLVSFATLSLVSANADKRLSERLAGRTKSYYEACNNAECSIATIDTTLRQIYSQAVSEEEYFAKVGHTKSYALPISELQTLSLQLTLLYPMDENGPFYHIDSWKIITTGNLEYDNKLHVFGKE